MPQGSKPGEHRGGRAKGTRNHASVAREKAVAESGATPLDGLLFVYRHYLCEVENLLKAPPHKRDRAAIKEALMLLKDSAKEAAPYTHPRLAALAALRPPDPTATSLEQMLLQMMELPANQNADAGLVLIEGELVDKTDVAAE